MLRYSLKWILLEEEEKNLFQDYHEKMYRKMLFPHEEISELDAKSRGKLYDAILTAAENYGSPEQQQEIEKHLYGKHPDTMKYPKSTQVEWARELAHGLHHDRERKAYEEIIKKNYPEEHIKNQLDNLHKKKYSVDKKYQKLFPDDMDRHPFEEFKRNSSKFTKDLGYDDRTKNKWYQEYAEYERHK